MNYREIAPFILIESSEPSPDFQESSISPNSLPDWVPVPALISSLSKLLRSESVYTSISQSQGYIPVSTLLTHDTIRGFSLPCMISSLAKLPYVHFFETAGGLVVSVFSARPCVKIASSLNSHLSSVIGEMYDYVKEEKKGVDLYVKLTNGTERVFKNNSEYYKQKKQEGKKRRSTGKKERVDTAFGRISLNDITNSTQDVVKTLRSLGK